MDQLNCYRATIRKTPDNPVRGEVVYEPVLDHFERVECGWQSRRRIHGVIYHLDIIDGKIWVQFDATDRPIANNTRRSGNPASRHRAFGETR